MAFQQPVARPAAPVRQLSEQPAPASPARKRLLEESQEWILFSPTTHEQQSNPSATLRTATQPSTYGSLETHVLSQPRLEGDPEAVSDDNGDEAAELDSLDDGLHAFHHPFSTSSAPLDVSGGSVLPRHDGFGAFPSSAGLQQQLWQFERHNPQRRKLNRRRSSVQRQLDAIEDGQADIEDERTARIEKWRLEQGHAVLEEIEKETRRQRRRISRMSDVSGSVRIAPHLLEAAIEASPFHSEQAAIGEPIAVKPEAQQPSESFWQRITRRVIQDLIGLDDNTLSVIFGESLVEDTSPTPRQTSPLAAAASRESRVSFQDKGHGWETKLLDRIARELGVLVHCLSSQDGAFSSYLHLHEELDYAGLGPPSRDKTTHRQPALRKRRRQQSSTQTATAMPTAPLHDSLFVPTLGATPLSPLEAPDSSLWGIEEEPLEEAEQQQREYWERDIDLRAVFNYLHDRLLNSNNSNKSGITPHPPTTNDNNPLLPASWATSTSQPQTQSQSQQESLFHRQRRAEAIRRQHPLVSLAAQQSSRRRHHESLLLRRQLSHSQRQRVGSGTAGGSSCASQSTRRSRQSLSAASSRHFWDLGGSVGSVGSAAVVGSAVGGWGEL